MDKSSPPILETVPSRAGPRNSATRLIESCTYAVGFLDHQTRAEETNLFDEQQIPSRRFRSCCPVRSMQCHSLAAAILARAADDFLPRAPVHFSCEPLSAASAASRRSTSLAARSPSAPGL